MKQNKGIWLPIELLNDKDTTFQEKLILVEVSQLTMLDKGCIASNNHFAELFKIKKESVSRSINSLERKGYISSHIVPGTRNHSRIITINKLLSDSKQNVIVPLTKCLETKENKPVNKPKKKSDFDLFVEILRERVDIKSKITVTKDTKKLFDLIEDKSKLLEAYLYHQHDKKDFAKRLTPFLLDYKPVTNYTNERTIGGYTIG